LQKVVAAKRCAGIAISAEWLGLVFVLVDNLVTDLWVNYCEWCCGNGG